MTRQLGQGHGYPRSCACLLSLLLNWMVWVVGPEKLATKKVLLAHLSQWFHYNKLVLDMKQTEFMTFSTR